jgi:hypothetical protein
MQERSGFTAIGPFGRIGALRDTGMMLTQSPARRRSALAAALVAAGIAAAPARASDPVGAALIRPERPAASLGEIRLMPVPGCLAGADCAVFVAAELHPAAGDRRRVGFAFDWPAATLPRGEGAWRCRPLAEREVVCFARPDEIAAQPASRLIVRLPAAEEGRPEPKLCPRPVDTAYRDLARAANAGADERQVRLLQALADEARGAATAVPDGIVAGETRQMLTAQAREAGLPGEPEAVMVAALVGQEFNRAQVALPACVALMVPPAVARPPVYAPPFEDTVLMRPWRVRPFNGLRRLFGG